jgi:hypothetical protein
MIPRARSKTKTKNYLNCMRMKSNKSTRMVLRRMMRSFQAHKLDRIITWSKKGRDLPFPKFLYLRYNGSGALCDRP